MPSAQTRRSRLTGVSLPVRDRDGLGLKGGTRNEVDATVRAVAVRLRRRVAAAAELHDAVGRDGDHMSVAILDGDRPAHDVRAVRLDADAGRHAGFSFW